MFNKPVDQLSEADIVGLIVNSVREGRTVEFKSAAYGKTDSDKKEMLKDITSFANTAGGILVLGIREVDGQAVEIVPLDGLEIDKEIQRIDQLVQSAIEPRIPGFRAVPVRVENGNVIVLSIPASWASPHRVTIGGDNRFYARNSSGTYQPDVEELRTMFARVASASDQAREFHNSRLSGIDNKATPIVLSGSADRMVLHVVPFFSTLSAPCMLDLEKANSLQHLLRPIDATSYTPAINFDGCLISSLNANGRGAAYTQLYRSGRLEAVRTGIVTPHENTRWLVLERFEKWLVQSLPEYLGAMIQLDIVPPLAIYVTLQNVDGAVPHIGRGFETYDAPRIGHRELRFSEMFIGCEQPEKDLSAGIERCCDEIWNAAGFLKSRNFKDGKWIVPI